MSLIGLRAKVNIVRITSLEYALIGIGIVSITTLIAAYIGLYNPRPFPALEYHAPELPMADLEEYKVYMVARSVFAHKVLVQLLESGLDEENVEYYLPAEADAKSIILYDANKVMPLVFGYPTFIAADHSGLKGYRDPPPHSICFYREAPEPCTAGENFGVSVNVANSINVDDMYYAEKSVEVLRQWLAKAPIVNGTSAG